MTISRVRALRRNQTEAERLLWSRLRDRQLAGLRLLRCALVVELDGGQHGQERHLKHDEARTMWLVGEGFHLLRFWNNEVMDNVDGVLPAIADVVQHR